MFLKNRLIPLPISKMKFPSFPSIVAFAIICLEGRSCITIFLVNNCVTKMIENNETIFS